MGYIDVIYDGLASRMMSSMSMGDFISPTGSNLSPLENSALRVSHEHTDSGLGADQDYAYSSERWDLGL